MRIGETFRKAAGLFIELPPEEQAPVRARSMSDISMPSESISDPMPSPAPRPAPASARTVEDLVKDSPGPNLDEIKVPDDTKPPTVSADGKGDFGQIYHQAGLPAVPFSAEQVLELIATLPAELPLETKRQSVKVMLNAMGKATGVTPEIIVTDASRKLAALAAFTDQYSKAATTFINNASQEIVTLEAQIAAKKSAIESAKVQQAHVSEVCHSESDRLDDVLEFFSLDVAPSKYARPET